MLGAAARADASGSDQPAGQQVVALTQSDFVLLVLLLAAVFYAVVAVIYRAALGPSKSDRLLAAAGAKRS